MITHEKQAPDGARGATPRSTFNALPLNTIAAAIVLVSCAAAASCVAKAPAGDGRAAPPAIEDVAAQRGLAYAQRRCATCHAINAGQTSSPLPSAPSFDVVANTPGMTRTALNAWLHSPHSTMPELVVPSSDQDDLAAYLESLQRHGGRA